MNRYFFTRLFMIINVFAESLKVRSNTIETGKKMRNEYVGFYINSLKLGKGQLVSFFRR